MKYTNTEVVLREVPREISLVFNISGCPFCCPGCHSPEMRRDIGAVLTENNLLEEICRHPGVSCILFMGGDGCRDDLFSITKSIPPAFKKAWYSGSDDMSILDEAKKYFDYIKIGSYKEELGPLDNPNTNQKFFKVNDGDLEDITYLFQKNEKNI